MFDNSNLFQSSSLDQLERQYQSQLDALNRMKAASQDNIIQEISQELGSLSKDELSALYDTNEYKGAKSIYETSFLQFISNKFSQEYIQTPEGREAGLNLLKTIRESKDKIAYQAKVKSEKIERVLELLETDPEMRKRYQELIDQSSNKKLKQ